MVRMLMDMTWIGVYLRLLRDWDLDIPWHAILVGLIGHVATPVFSVFAD